LIKDWFHNRLNADLKDRGVSSGQNVAGKLEENEAEWKKRVK
jgi:hypothetical protein